MKKYIKAEEFLRYLNWRILGEGLLGTEAWKRITISFGTDEIIVTENGKLESPGGRGKDV